ncbi:MAG: hypothetical protein ACRD0A_13825, partial [Acidimicrobiales bacterium]
MTARILDGNVLIALAAVDHVHHETVVSWFQRSGVGFVTTPMTQGTLIRFLIRNGLTGGDAMSVLEAVVGHERHEFMPDD